MPPSKVSEEKTWHFLTPEAMASAFLTERFHCGRPRAQLLTPAPVILPLEPIQLLLLRVCWLSPSINLTRCSPPKPLCGPRGKKRLGVGKWKRFLCSWLFLQVNLLENCCLYCFQALGSCYTNTSLEGSVSPCISFHGMRTSGKHGNHSTNWEC